MSVRDLSAVILSAGFSSRMGDFKPLLPLGPHTVVDQVVRTCRDAGIEDVLVVLGHNREAMRSHLQPSGVTLVDNPDFETGMFSSVQAGVSRLSPQSKGFFMMPVDIPLVRPWTIKLLGQALVNSNADVIFPCFQGRRGHPPLIRQKIVPEIVRADRALTLRDILGRCQADTLEVPDRNILFDIDVMDDYRELRIRWERMDIPTREECEVICRSFGCSDDDVQAHCETVAAVAGRIGQALNDAGEHLDLNLIEAAALVHDMAKTKQNHAAVAGEWLSDMGFHRVGEIVAGHTDLDVQDDATIGEAEVVYLADKFVRGEIVETLESRFQAALTEHGHDPEIRQRIEARRKRAEKSKTRLESRLNRSLYDVILK